MRELDRFDYFLIFIITMVSGMVILLAFTIYDGTIGYTKELESKTIEINKLCNTNLTTKQVELLQDNLDITECI